ncbi:MAG: type IX secretion system membrane protein PorP/SprF [Flavobacteriales bacterium]|nr:type IX secretion system membrane protein PorP/SprF [Flavobacteriales bacterium]
MYKGLRYLHILFPSWLNEVRLILCISGLFMLNLPASAQHDAMFSQYMFNKLIVNPGYAGSTGTFNAASAYRRQFIGLEGSPRIQAITLDGQIKNKPMGLGLKAIHETIGVTSKNKISAIYAYHLDLAKGRLSLGVEGGIFNQSIDFSGLRKTVPDDNAIPIGKESILVPDAAFGLYYSSEKLFLGGALYHLLQNELNYSGYTGNDRTLISKLSSHSYVLAGYTFKPKENLRIEPSLLLKYVAGAPVQIDMNINATFKNVFTIGGTYRTQNTIVFLFQYSFKDLVKFGYAYDYSISGLSSYGFGTHGITLSYHLTQTKSELEIEQEDTIPGIIAIVDSLPVQKDSLEEDSLSISVTPPIEDTVETITPTPVELPAMNADDTSAANPQVIAKEDPPATEDPVSNEEKLAGEEEPPEEISNPEPPDKQKVEFKIQLLARKEPIYMTPVNFKGLENVEEYEEDGLFKYTIGLADNYDYARRVLLNEMKMQGFQDAFIVAFYEGKRISVKEALKLSKK